MMLTGSKFILQVTNLGKPRKTMETLWKNQQKPKETKENQVPGEENANVS